MSAPTATARFAGEDGYALPEVIVGLAILIVMRHAGDV